ncbi:hypothetical protein H2198_000832 [Neophaeococcomyces mojaviensis]|uniref:Uncharacterized protein n=1 Tax=Neophaeococcomyces mojaviensis TaxID=3383035 RepID=A0ACC3AIJ9_9EURO|nr:hypothetical protein H2198_000832 [Knufia sp. JES_112]
MLDYTYAFTSKMLTEVTKNVLATSITGSSVDLEQMDDVTIRDTVSFCYGGAPHDVQKNIMAKLSDSRDKYIKNKNHPEEYSRARWKTASDRLSMKFVSGEFENFLIDGAS